MPTRNAPKEARRIVFRREQAQTARHVDKQDIILAVSRGLAQADFPGFVRANDAGYSSTWAVTVVLENGALGSMLVPVHWGLVVAAAQQVDPAMRSAELPEQWYRAKVHGVSIFRYLSRGLGLAREEVELGTRIRLKRDPSGSGDIGMSRVVPGNGPRSSSR
jgi:inactivated superfamily I helicase